MCGLDHIDRILSGVRDYWKAHPDMRLMEMLVTAVEGCWDDPYYVEDDALLADLKDYYKGKGE